MKRIMHLNLNAYILYTLYFTILSGHTKQMLIYKYLFLQDEDLKWVEENIPSSFTDV